MGALHHNCDALRFEDLRDRECDLFGQSFLDLQAAGKHLGETGELGEAEDAPVRDVANVHLKKGEGPANQPSRQPRVLPIRM